MGKISLFLLISLGGVLLWSFIRPADYFTWGMEAFPVFIGVPILLATGRKFPLTRLLYICLWAHGIILLVGAHYTYAEVPLFNWLRDSFDLSRNYYDWLGHLAQGFVPALAARELLIRTSPLKTGKWMFAIVTLSCLGISAAYELLEWATAEMKGEAAEAFLGTQGDIWDTQKDMLMALIGAAAAQLLLGRFHDRLLQEKIGKKSGK